MNYIAHIRRLDKDTWADPQPLSRHLKGTAELASEFAADFNSSDWAYALGMAHDTGKATVEWQRYLRGKSGFDYDAEASSETHGRKEHSTSGAKLVEDLFANPCGRFLAYCVAGHHAGLADWSGKQSSLRFRLQNASAKDIADQAKTALKPLCPKTSPWPFSRDGLDVSLWIRMLFSCLVDADRLDTERYENPDAYQKRGAYRSIAELREDFDQFMAEKTKASGGEPHVYEARQLVLADCMAAAEWSPGLFSLSVPTGGGKTLSSMAFALKHAEKYGKKRIIYVIPYTSIIEQNADVFRNVFGKDVILEHHSNLDDNETTVRSRAAAENWDAPLIVTTNVQFFESLFAAKTSRCRKLHNIANSVVIFDEAQLLPPDFLESILETVRLLADHYHVSFVMCTATQPVFEKREAFPRFPGLPEASVREIVQDVPSLYKNLQRVDYEFPDKDAPPREWNALAAELVTFEQALCVVSDRKSCRELYAATRQLTKDNVGTYHLSALMCAQHRTEVIAEIKDRLEQGERVLLISTQVIEAGVDIDFPVVYRAMAGLDSIAQTAGRCNREGKLNAQGKRGKVVVFNAPRKAPPGFLRKAVETAQLICKNSVDNLTEQRLFENYFQELYWKANSLDKKEIMKLLKLEPDYGIQFRSAAEAFKLIGNDMRAILVPYGDGAKRIALLEKSEVPERVLLRKLQRYTVNVYPEQFAELQRRGSLKEVLPDIYALNSQSEYNTEIGLLVDEISSNPEHFIKTVVSLLD
ncbi:MAG: CRISPR-associated helicase Cas3' [Treponema sp.]|jgi:CRISPR-associated endonuclease/helicase Cas3|nr:CRISPR-associated helicase Cas3' [Treponema sp.]